MESLNKGHVGDNINSVVLSFIERWFSCIKIMGKVIFGTLSNVLNREVYYRVPYGGHTIGGPTVQFLPYSK